MRSEEVIRNRADKGGHFAKGLWSRDLNDERVCAGQGRGQELNFCQSQPKVLKIIMTI